MSILRYIGVQVGCFALDLIVFMAAYWLGIPVFYANVLSKICSGVTAFLLQRHWVFKSTHESFSTQSFRYLGLWLANIPLTSWLVVVLYRVTENALVSKILVDGVAFVVNYIISRYFIFKK